MKCQWIRARFQGSELRSYQRHFAAHTFAWSARSAIWPQAATFVRAPRDRVRLFPTVAAGLLWAVRSPARNWPVYELASAATCSGVPAAITLPALLTSLWPHVDQPICALDHVEIVLDHHDTCCRSRRAAGAPRADAAHRRSATPRGLVEDVHRAPGRDLPRARWQSLTRWASPPESVVAGWPSRM